MKEGYSTGLLNAADLCTGSAPVLAREFCARAMPLGCQQALQQG